MTNKKNSISESEVKNASGGYVLEKGSAYVAYGNQTDKELKRFHRTNANDNTAKDKAVAFDDGYHLGKNEGNLEGQQIGFENGFNRAKKIHDEGGIL